MLHRKISECAFMQLPALVLRYQNQGETTMQTLGKIAATLGVIGAIAIGSAAPAAAWYGYHSHYGYHHHYGYYHHPYRHYGYYHHRHLYGYYPYHRRYWGGY
jgi:hypothetical protein